MEANNVLEMNKKTGIIPQELKMDLINNGVDMATMNKIDDGVNRFVVNQLVSIGQKIGKILGDKITKAFDSL